MNIPSDLKYTKDHEWVRIEGDEAIVGITDFAQSELGDIVFVEIETEAIPLTKKTSLVVSKLSKPYLICSCLSAKLRHGSELDDTPELVNSDPYNKGWMIRIKISDTSQMDGLLSADAYRDLIG